MLQFCSISVTVQRSSLKPSLPPQGRTVRTLIRILVVDDYAPWWQLLRCKLGMHDEFEAVAECGDGPEAI